jgi:hypothetical protein
MWLTLFLVWRRLVQWGWDKALDKEFLDVTQQSFDCSENQYHGVQDVAFLVSYLWQRRA